MPDPTPTSGPITFAPPRWVRPGSPAGPAGNAGSAEAPRLVVAPPAPLPVQTPPPLADRVAELPPLDWALVSRLRDQARDRAVTLERTSRADNRSARVARHHQVAADVVAEHVRARQLSGDPGAVDHPGYTAALTAAVAALLTGLGRLQPLIDDPAVENIMVLGTRVRVVYAGGRVDTNSFTAAADDGELIELMQRLAADGATERSLTPGKPILHLQLPDGARLTVAYQVTPRPVVAIRRHRVVDLTLDDLVRWELMDPRLREFLRAAMAARMNIIVAGLPNSGKTTLLRALADEIPADEWFAVLETVRELGLHDNDRHPWAVSFEEREGFGERTGDGRPEGTLTVNDLFPHMLRLSTTRIVVGEVREAEIVAMFDAMNTTRGSLCTVHARDESGIFDRLAELLMRYGASRHRQGAYLTIANAIDLVVHVDLDDTPGQPARRYVSHVYEVLGPGDSDTISRSALFAPSGTDPSGLARPTGVRPAEHRVRRLARFGLDMSTLTSPTGPTGPTSLTGPGLRGGR